MQRADVNRIDPALQFLIERVSSSTDALIFREIFLAALLIMCNAAETFLRAELENLANRARFTRERRIFLVARYAG